MDRRGFLRVAGAGVVGSCVGEHPLWAASRPAAGGEVSGRQLLSQQGCSRATGYAEANRIVTLDGKTHAAWLDSEAEGFRVKVRTLDHASGRWSPAVTVGHAHDNHGGPALTVDSEGYLHIVYFPHHHPFRYRKSLRPNDASAWQAEYETFGQRCTYPTLVCGPDDTLYLTCRESRKEGPWWLNMYWKKPGGDWEGPRALMHGLAPGGYAHFQESLAWGPDHRRLHLACRVYDGKPGRGHTIGYMRSDDYGATWQRADGTAIELPATPETVTNIEQSRNDGKRSLRGGALAIDGKGRPHVVYSAWGEGMCRLTWARLDDSEKWIKRPLEPYPADDWKAWRLSMPGNMHIGEDGRIVIAATLIHFDIDNETEAWGHPTNEVAVFDSHDGGAAFAMRVVSRVDRETPHWLVNLEKPTGFNQVKRPGLIYTGGTRAEDNRQIVSNEVWWVAL